MKTILIIYPGFPHYRNGIIEALLESKDYNYIFAGDKTGYNTLKPYDFKNHPNFRDFPAYNLLGLFNFNKGLLRFALTQKAHGAIVHASPYWTSIILASLILRIRGIKVYNWTHGILTEQRNPKNKFYYYFNKYLFEGLLLYGNISKKNLIHYGYEKDKIEVIYNSLDYKAQMAFRGTLDTIERNDIRKSLFANPDLGQLIFIGRLTGQKKLNILLEAMTFLKKKGILVNLLFVGDGEEKTKLEEQVGKYGIEHQICFYGASYDEATNYKLIASSDCCVAPGEIGLTAIHALMYGVPVISHSNPNAQMPEFEAIIPGLNGDLFEQGNVDDLGRKIEGILDFKTNKSEQEIQKDCYKIVDQYYNPSYQVEVIEKVFDQNSENIS